MVLMASATGSEQPERPPPIGPDPVLEAGKDPSLEPDEAQYGHQHRVDDYGDDRDAREQEREPLQTVGQESV